MAQQNKHIFLTGPPGCGKTTAVQRVVEMQPDIAITGFYTQEVREEGRRSGFEMVGLSTGRRIMLASVHSTSELRLRRYGIELMGLEEIVQLEFAVESPAQLIVIDEVGKIELYSQHFVDRVRSILDSDIPVLGTVAIRGEGLIAEVKSRPDTELIEVNDDNRDELPRQIAEQLSTLR